MKRVAITIGVMLATMVGCANLNAGGNGPDHVSAGDTNSIVHHAKEYWGKRGTETEPLKVEPVKVDVEPNKKDPVESQGEEQTVAEAVAQVIRKFRQACQSKQEFYIEHNGIKERYACLDISKYGSIPIDWSRVKEEHSDYVF